MKTTPKTTRDETPNELERMVRRFPDLNVTSARRWLAAGESMGRFLKARQRDAPLPAAAPTRAPKMAEAM